MITLEARAEHKPTMKKVWEGEGRYEMIFEIVDRKALVALEYSIKNCCKAIIQLLIYFRKHRRREHEIVGEFLFG